MLSAKTMMKYPGSLYRRNSIIVERCNCRPSCTTIEYNAEMYQSMANFEKSLSLNPERG